MDAVEAARQRLMVQVFEAWVGGNRPEAPPRFEYTLTEDGLHTHSITAQLGGVTLQELV